MAKARAAAMVIPKGYKVLVSAELPATWDFAKNPMLEGTVQTVQKVKVTGKEGVRVSRVAHVANKDGIFGLWESATLSPLFDALEGGEDVLVRYEGMGEAKPGRSAPKLFTACIKG